MSAALRLVAGGADRTDENEGNICTGGEVVQTNVFELCVGCEGGADAKMSHVQTLGRRWWLSCSTPSSCFNVGDARGGVDVGGPTRGGGHGVEGRGKRRVAGDL